MQRYRQLHRQIEGESVRPRSTSRRSRADLISAWIEFHGGPPPKGISTRLLALAAEYDAQARRDGHLKPATQRTLYAIAMEQGDPRKRAHRLQRVTEAPPGARLVREWHGQAHVVDVQDNGVLYRGQRYRSLSEVARAITGARWSGPRFFGL